MSKHTPGPWAARALVDHIEIVPVNDLGIQPTLARIEKWAREGVNESNANARLIAAAPALLEALKVLLNNNEMLTGEPAARAAIAKAEGEKT